MKKVGPYPKYQFKYSQDDYKYNIEYKKQAKANQSHSAACQEFYIEITPKTVQKVTEELAMSIIQGIAEEKELIYVRFAETGGHCVDLRNFKLINTLNGKTRQIYLEFPEGKKLIKLPQQSKIQPSKSKLIYSQFHWFERKNGKFVPLQLSFSDAVEQFYQQFLSNGVSLYEIMWQQHRFVIDMKNNTLENASTYEINHIQRRNIQKSYQEPHAKKISRGAMKKIVWQYQLQPKSYEWNNYSEENCKELEKAYEGYNKDSKKANTLNVIKNTSKYYIDFDQMIEYNLTTKERRQIRRFLVEE